jgi:hypothetical protein
LINTVILNQDEIKIFNKAKGLIKTKLLYRGSRDGTSSTTFHNKCNSMGATLTLIKTKDNYVFGGYTQQSWSSSGGSVTDTNAYLFVLRQNNITVPSWMQFNARETTSYYSCSSSLCGNRCCYVYSYYYATFNNPSYGPTFGNSYNGDISIPDRFDIRAGSSSGLANYSNTYGYISSYIRSSWVVSDVEVFQIS